MKNFKRNNLLSYLPLTFPKEKTLNSARIFYLNQKKIKNGYIIYLCEREIRSKDNFTLQFALNKSKELNLPLKIICQNFSSAHKTKENFIKSQIEQTKKDFLNIGIDFKVIEENIRAYIKNFDF